MRVWRPLLQATRVPCIHRGIEANPEKIKAIEDMSPPQTLKEMQKLAGRVTALGHFISKLGERALPFFKLMKKKGPLSGPRRPTGPSKTSRNTSLAPR